MQETFSIAKVPLVIDMKDISKLNTDYFNIQIQIIFEVFAQKIDQLIHDKFFQFDFFEDEVLIKTVRAISKNISSIVIFEDLYKNDFIRKFVMSYFNITSIDNASIENSIENDHKLNGNEISNIKATIFYLSSLKDDFKVLLFDFENPSNCENLFSEFSKFDTFLYLANFCMFSDLNLNLKQEDFSDSFASKLFKIGNIPLIVNQKILSNFEYEDVLPDSLFYQLQFIYDVIDSFPGSRKVVECFMISMKKLQIIKIPSREVILSRTESKAASQFSKNIYELAKEDENTKSNKTIEIFEETIKI
ncbi:hypothetical protein M9Y10_020495 [Tritrichomonas musculus]|uniref:Uncharacterized protein n=1 Tax=Tritrichomonas musculus TaxID=1915356 RepID=A0ABR2HGA5_9EUKA